VYDVVTQHAANQNPAAVLNEVPSWPKLITSPERIATERYYDQGCYQAEIENLWQMACRLEQIPKLGDWVEYANVGRSAIVVHTKRGIKAFDNACRHRGVPIGGGTGGEHGNCAKVKFICPFHGWRWTMAGENTFVYGKHIFNGDG
jgi:phenylpropionate dioxygenase-like ring-hydroxylating dioxygenase large terminal subunit